MRASGPEQKAVWILTVEESIQYSEESGAVQRPCEIGFANYSLANST